MADQVVLPPMNEGEDADEDLPGDHAWHYRYNRRLSCFQHSVSSLTFSQDGQWLISATKSGQAKVFDTEYWAERAKLPGCRNEEPRVICLSPAQRWLVCMFPSTMLIFQGRPPWRLEQRVPPPRDARTKENSEWVCCSFSPLTEVDHPGGHTGQDNHLVAFASKSLCVLDYSGGWDDTPKRTACILNEQRPTSIAYTACGSWVVCGYESGQLQIWNHFSLTLERTLMAHTATVSCIASSPRKAEYDPRFISCGLDCTMRVWHTNGWLLEQITPDTKADRNGIRSCMFSCNGDWVVSVAVEMCIWRVCISRKRRLELRLHQRLSAICGAEGLCAAAICNRQDAVAVGSRDGVLGLWTKLAGWPAEHGQGNDASTLDAKRETGRGSVTPWIMTTTTLSRPMMHVSPHGPRSHAAKDSAVRERRSLRNSEWFVRTDLRSLSSTAQSFRLPQAIGHNRGAKGERASKSSLVTSSPFRHTMRSRISTPKLPNANVQRVSAFGMETDTSEADALMHKSNSMPEVSRWKPTSFECDDVLGALRTSPLASATIRHATESPRSLRERMQKGPLLKNGRVCNANVTSRGFGNQSDGELPQLFGQESLSPVREAIKHASRGLVQRISLDPQHIC